MFRAILSFAVCAMLLSCSNKTEEKPMTWVDTDTGKEEPVPAELQEKLSQIGDAQAKGLDVAMVTIHGAYNYKGYSYLEPIEGAKLISVDVEFFGYKEDFDLDDIDIIEGKTGENYGSYPDISLLTLEGKIETNESNWPNPPGPLRVLLIYAMPDKSTSVKLSYWGKMLVAEVTTLSEGGPTLEKPKKKSDSDK